MGDQDPRKVNLGVGAYRTEAGKPFVLEVVREAESELVADLGTKCNKDAYATRLFLNEGFEFFMCQSFAKNLGLYGERIGMMHVICPDAAQAKAVLSQVKVVIRPMYSSPPKHGAELVMKILGNPDRYAKWKAELKAMADRILEVRDLLRKGLEAKGTPGTWVDTAAVRAPHRHAPHLPPEVWPHFAGGLEQGQHPVHGRFCGRGGEGVPLSVCLTPFQRLRPLSLFQGATPISELHFQRLIFRC